jgi:ABC-type phosphate transport system auxiliary subunit
MRLRRRTIARRSDSPAGADRAEPQLQLAELQQRLEQLEAAFEGLQDSVHRESVRHHEQLHDLIKSTQPAAVARALSDDARRRGV